MRIGPESAYYKWNISVIICILPAKFRAHPVNRIQIQRLPT